LIGTNHTDHQHVVLPDVIKATRMPKQKGRNSMDFQRGAERTELKESTLLKAESTARWRETLEMT
jgi:hypothetical protein